MELFKQGNWVYLFWFFYFSASYYPIVISVFCFAWQLDEWFYYIKDCTCRFYHVMKQVEQDVLNCKNNFSQDIYVFFVLSLCLSSVQIWQEVSQRTQKSVSSSQYSAKKIFFIANFARIVVCRSARAPKNTEFCLFLSIFSKIFVFISHAISKTIWVYSLSSSTLVLWHNSEKR